MEENKNYVEDLLSNLEGANLENKEIDFMAVLLTLDEDEFNEISGPYLLEMQKALSRPENRMAIARMISNEDVNITKIKEDFEVSVNKIDTEFKEVMSEQKREFIKQLMVIIYNAMAEVEGIAKKIIQVPIEKCHEDAKIPVYANITDAGADLYAVEDIIINPGETVLIPTGLKVAIPRGYEIQVRPKSGRALKTKMRVANSPGTIDSGYRDELKVIIDNIEPPFKDIKYHFDDNGKIIIDSILHGSSYSITKGDKFAQLVLSEVPKIDFVEVSDVSKFEGDRGGGFGSTGIK